MTRSGRTCCRRWATGDTNGLIISPYYNYYVIRAMAEMGHREEALKWIRQYWGGMVDEGATSFWEAYDPSWYQGGLSCVAAVG